MLERRHVAFYARSSNVSEETAERDIVLTYVLRILSNSILPKLALKGGTCLKKVYLGKTGRFSMDLDFTSTGIEQEELRSSLKDSLHNTTHYDLTFEVADENIRPESYLAVVRYTHAWNPGSEFFIEVSFRERPALPTVELPLHEEMYLRYCEFQAFPIKCMQKEELLAEKIRAAYQRARGRDLYDLYLFTKLPYNKDVVKTLTVIKCWNVRDPFKPESLFERVEDADYNWADLQRLVRKGDLPSRRDMIRAVKEHYAFLGGLDRELQTIVRDSRAHRESNLVRRLISNSVRTIQSAP